MNIHVLKFLLMLSTTILLTFSIISCSEDNEVIDFSNIGTQFNEAGLPIDIPNNMIVYKSESGEIIDVFEDRFGEARVKSNVYDKVKGYGVITFWDDVKYITSHAFSYGSYGDGKYLKSIVLPKSVISIGKYAFADQSYMTSITMQGGLQDIRERAFMYCTSLKTVNLPNGLKNISSLLFYGCSSLTSVTIPNSVTSIGSSAFSNCTNLTDVIIPNSVTSIEINAFVNCYKLYNVTIPKSVEYISNYAFEGCRNFNQILVDEKNPVYDSRENCNAIIKTKTNELIVGCNNTQIPNSIKSIGDYAFIGSGIKSILIPDSVSNVGSRAFFNCDSLKLITVMSSTPPTCTDDSFSHGGIGHNNDIYSNAILNVPASSKETYQKAQGWSKFKNIVEGNFVENITWDFNSSTGTLLIEGEGRMPNYSLYNESPFDSNDNIKSVKIGDGVLSIGEYAFYNCTGITSIDIPNTVMTIGQRAFVNCMSLSSIIIPNSVTNIGDLAFFACKGLTSIIIPSSMTNIGKSAFASCGELANIKVVDGNTIYYDSRENCNAIIETETNTLIVGCKNTIIPSSVTNIGEEAFYGSDLTTLIIPEGVEFIGNSAFYGCDKLTTLEIQNSTPPAVGTLGLGLSDKTKVIVPNGSLKAYKAADDWKDIPNIVEKETLTGECGENVNWSLNTTTGHLVIEGEGEMWNYHLGYNSPFNSNEDVKSIEIKEGVTNIGPKVFYNCINLANVDIPNTVTSIENQAFYGCTSLKYITVPASVVNIGHNTFEGCNNLTTIEMQGSIPPSVGTLGLSLTEKTKVIVPNGSLETYKTADGWKDVLNMVENRILIGECGDNVTWNFNFVTSHLIIKGKGNMRDYSYYSTPSPFMDFKENIYSVEIEDGVESIGANTFCFCSNLNRIEIPKSVSTLGIGAFEGCSSLTNVNLPDYLKVIGSRCFFECSNITDNSQFNNIYRNANF